jgi:NTP pyrophosphatase (non-canonical NTP hydrolase)
VKTLQALMDKIVAFGDERDWGKFHTPRQLATALAIECGELQETMLWKTDDDVKKMLLSGESRQAFEDEVADVLIYVLLLSAQTQVDPARAVMRKLVENCKKYPSVAGSVKVQPQRPR